MSSVSSALSTILDPITVSGSSNSASSGTSSGATFNGASSYSQDLQSTISRAVAVAELPITQLTNQQTALQSQANELSKIDQDLAALQAAVQGIGQALSGSAFQCDLSNPDAVSASVGDGAAQGSYSIEVESIGVCASSLSSGPWAGNSSANGGTFSLVIGGISHSIQSADGSAASVAAAINAQYGDQVQATVVNVGSDDSPDQRISLQSTSLGPQTLDIQNSSGASLQTQGPVGSPARYIVDGSGLTVTSDSRSVTIASGLTLNLLSSDPGHPVSVTVTRSDSALSGALAAFAGAYNTVVADLQSQRGQSNGPLQGQTILSQITQAIDNMATYFAPSSAGVSSLANLGLSLGLNGQLTFNAFTLAAVDIRNSAAVTSFLGSAAGEGWLGAVTASLNNLEDPSQGLVKSQEAGLQRRITSIGDQITTKQEQVKTLQANLTSQMAAADALIATMQQQYSFLSQMMQAQQIAYQAYTNG